MKHIEHNQTGFKILKKNSKHTLIGSDLRYFNLSGADLSSVDLRKVDLNEADLRKADLHAADLRKANLRKANLRKANLRKADLSGADLSGADLRKADLSGADLSGANLRKADLNEADLSGADLNEVDLSGANLDKAILSGANMNGANLRKVWVGVRTQLHRQTNIIDAGVDIRGFRFWAWYDTTNKVGKVVYRAGCREWFSYASAIAHYSEKTYCGHGNRLECIRRLDVLKGWADSDHET